MVPPLALAFIFSMFTMEALFENVDVPVASSNVSVSAPPSKVSEVASAAEFITNVSLPAPP